MNIKFKSLCLSCVLAIALVSIGAPTIPNGVQPDVRVISAGASEEQIREAISSAAKLHLPVAFAPGVYEIARSISLPAGSVIRGMGAMLRTTRPISIFEVPEGYVELDDLTFDADPRAGATAIHGSLLRSKVAGCTFWTNLKYGIDATGQMTFIERNGFGMPGPLNPRFQALRMVADTFVNNAVFIDGNHFYHSGAEHAIEIQFGAVIQLTRNNIERNNTKGAAVKLLGVSQALIQGNWFEANAGDAQIQTVVEPSGEEGCYVVDVADNWFAMTHSTNRTIISAGGACGIHFDHNAGNTHGGKLLCDNPPAIQSCNGNHVIAMKE